VINTLFSWSASGSSGSISGFSNSLVPGTLINQALVNTSFTDQTVIYLITPHANGCDGITYTFVVTVHPQPNLSNTPLNKQQCNNLPTNITLTSNVTGTLFTWTATGSSASVTGFSDNAIPTVTLNQTLVNSGYNIETVTYHITPNANNCAGTGYDYMVTVYPTPDLSNAPASKQICTNTATGITLISNVASTLFTWTATGSSGFITGYSNNTVPSTSLNQTLVNSGYNIETVTYSITPFANGCAGQVTDYIVTVYPFADVYYTPPYQTLCSGQTTNLQILSHVSGTTFGWTAFSSSPNISGFSDGSGNLISQTLTNSGTTIETVTYHTTPTANGCVGNPSNVIVTVNPTPIATALPLIQTICSGTTAFIALTSSVIGSTFSWTVSASSPNLSGYSAGNGNTINQTITNSGYTIDTLTYHIIPTANSCPGPVENTVVIVNPKPDISNNPMNSQICSSTSTNINLTSDVAGTTFTWTATPSSANVIGYSSGSGPLINQVLINLGFNIETVTYHITPSANGCLGLTRDFVVSVLTVPDVYFQPASQSICSNQTTSISNLSHVAGATFTWTATPSSGNLSGYSDGAGNLIAQTLLNSGMGYGTVTYTVTPHAFGCQPGTPHNVIVTVAPIPVVTNTVKSFSQCSAKTTNIVLQSNLPGAIYSWTASGSSGNITGFSNGTGSSINQTLINSGFNTEVATYSVTATVNGCIGNPAIFTVSVFPVPDAYFTPPSQTICSLQSTNILIKSHAAGGSFTWTANGSSGNITGYASGSGDTIRQTLTNLSFNVETVTYHVHPTANGCTGTMNNMIVTIDPNPFTNLPLCWDPVTTSDARPIILKGGTPLNGAYSGTGVTAGSFYPAVTGPGTFTISYTYTNRFGCSATATAGITVVATPVFSCGDTLTDVRDNRRYTTVQIGPQCWTSVNLNYGNTILSSLVQRDNCVFEKYCYNDTPSNCTSTGGLYHWDEMMKYDTTQGIQGFCPPGWHVPLEAEWNTLFATYISNGFAGSPLKYSGYSGFDAFLSGVRHENVAWDFQNFAVMYWSSTRHGNSRAWAHGLNSYNPSVSIYPGLRNNAFYVRCLKD